MGVRFSHGLQFNKKYMEISEYFNLEDILKLNLPNDIKEEIKETFGKKVFYEENDSCKMGVLIGIATHGRLNGVYYITNVNNNKNYVPIWKSITKV